MTDKNRQIKNWCTKDGLCAAPHEHAMALCFYFVPPAQTPPGLCLQYRALNQQCLGVWANKNAQNPALYTEDRYSNACRKPITEVKNDQKN